MLPFGVCILFVSTDCHTEISLVVWERGIALIPGNVAISSATSTNFISEKLQMFMLRSLSVHIIKHYTEKMDLFIRSGK